MKPRYKTLPAGYTPQPVRRRPQQPAQAGGMVTEGIGSIVVLGLAALGGYVLYQNFKKGR